MIIRKKLFLFNVAIVLCPVVVLLVLLFTSRDVLDVLFTKKDGQNGIIEMMLAMDKKLESIQPEALLNNKEVQSALFKDFSQDGFFVEIVHGDNKKIYNLEEIQQNKLSYVFVDGGQGLMSIVLDGKKENLPLQEEASEKLRGYLGLWIDELDFVYISRKINTEQGIISINVFTSDTMALLQGLNMSSILNLLFSVSFVFILGLVVILIVCFVCSFLLIKSIINPINKLSNAITRMKHGELEQSIVYENNDELSLVCQAFNDMQNTLKENLAKNKQYEKSRKEMLVGISHDLRTPLTSIISYVQALQEGMANDVEKQEKYLSVIHRKALNMEYLIQQLFHFSKLETKNMIFNMQSINLNTYLVNFLDKSEDEMRKLNVNLVYDDKEKDIMINADTDQLDRVLHNILNNSIKYVEKNPVIIHFSLQKEKNRVKFCIQDNGNGVDESIEGKIFDNFFCGNSSRLSAYKGKESGSGLGLPIVKNIIEAHGGSVYAENHQGLAIIMFLPLIP